MASGRCAQLLVAQVGERHPAENAVLLPIHHNTLNARPLSG